MGDPRRAVILDRDGVLNVDHGYVYEIERLDWIPGALAAVKRCNDAGYIVLVITNQSGIGRGYYDEESMHRLHRWMSDQVAASGGNISAFYFCPHHPDEGCTCRKPSPKLFNQAIDDWRLDAERSVAIGDRDSDVAASTAAGIRGHRFPGGNLEEFVAQLID